MNALVQQFNPSQIAIIDHDGGKWLTAEQLGLALGFSDKRARDGVNNLYNRHIDEFSEKDSVTVKLTATDGKAYKTRIFSHSGCNLLSFFANTPNAKAFRAWAKTKLAEHTIAMEAELAKPRGSSGIEGDMKLLAQGMTLVLQQNQLTHRYIDLLERNQKSRARISPDHAVEAKKLVAAGFSQSQAAAQLGISKAAVNALVNDKYEFGGEWKAPTPAKLLQRQLEEQRDAIVQALQLTVEEGEQS